jgi:DNA-binding SARP family transcriptional activator
MTVELYPPQAATATPPVDGTIDLGLLNGFELRQDGRIVRLPLSAQRLIAFLALHARPLRRLYVAGTLWLDSSQASANANLRTALWRLRRPGCMLVDATPTELALADGIAVDLHAASQRAQRVLSHDAYPNDVGGLAEVGDLLPDWYDDWLVVDGVDNAGGKTELAESVTSIHTIRS